MCYLGLGISLFPYIVPYSVTLWQAAAAPNSQAFLLVGTMFLLPSIFLYTVWSYYVFRGKVGRTRLSLSAPTHPAPHCNPLPRAGEGVSWNSRGGVQRVIVAPGVIA